MHVTTNIDLSAYTKRIYKKQKEKNKKKTQEQQLFVIEGRDHCVLTFSSANSTMSWCVLECQAKQITSGSANTDDKIYKRNNNTLFICLNKRDRTSCFSLSLFYNVFRFGHTHTNNKTHTRAQLFLLFFSYEVSSKIRFFGGGGGDCLVEFSNEIASHDNDCDDACVDNVR